LAAIRLPLATSRTSPTARVPNVSLPGPVYHRLADVVLEVPRALLLVVQEALLALLAPLAPLELLEPPLAVRPFGVPRLAGLERGAPFGAVLVGSPQAPCAEDDCLLPIGEGVGVDLPGPPRPPRHPVRVRGQVRCRPLA